MSGSTWLVIDEIAASLVSSSSPSSSRLNSCSSRGVHGGSEPMKTLNRSSGSRNSSSHSGELVA